MRNDELRITKKEQALVLTFNAFKTRSGKWLGVHVIEKKKVNDTVLDESEIQQLIDFLQIHYSEMMK